MDEWDKFAKEESLKNINYMRKRNLKKYLKENWIAITALIISAAAFVKSFFF